MTCAENNSASLLAALILLRLRIGGERCVGWLIQAER